MITLYKKGVTHTVRGVVCEALNCDASELAHYLDNGYVSDPQELLDHAVSDEPQYAEPEQKSGKKGKNKGK